MPSITDEERRRPDLITSVVAVSPGLTLELILAVAGAPGTARYSVDEVSTPRIDHEASFDNAGLAAKDYRVDGSFPLVAGGSYVLHAQVTTPPGTGERLIAVGIGGSLVYSRYIATSASGVTDVTLCVLVV